MPCTFTQWPADDLLQTHAEPVPGDGIEIGGPYLVVSNQPETLGLTDTNIQLYKCDIPLTAGTRRIRVFLWHASEDSEKTLRLKARISAGEGTVTNFKGYVDIIADLGNLGKCCARALLYNIYPTTFADKVLLGTETALLARDIPAGRTLGAMLEFDVTVDSTTVLTLRTHTGIVAFSTHPVTRPERHIRGWWPYSEATFPVGEGLDVNPLVPDDGVVWTPIEETNDFQNPNIRIVPPELKSGVFGHQAGDTWGSPLPDLPNTPLSGDVGLYGAIVKYRFSLTNSDSVERSAFLSLWTRNNGGKVFGQPKSKARVAIPNGLCQPSHGLLAKRRVAVFPNSLAEEQGSLCLQEVQCKQLCTSRRAEPVHCQQA